MDRIVTGVPVPPPGQVEAAPGERVALVDLLDRLLAGGVVITGDITISIANVDLVRISLRAIIASIRPEMERCVRALGDSDADVSAVRDAVREAEGPGDGPAW